MITLQNVDKQFGSKILYNDISTSINPIHRIGLIGPNGAGKTVLLRILVGQDSIDKGKITIPSNVKIGYLPQEMDITTTITPLDFMLESFKHLFEIESLIERLVSCGDTDSSEYKKAAHEYNALQSEFHIHDAYSLNSRAKTILAGLGVPQDNWERNITFLSGGYHMRVALARLLLISPDFLLLDEPTNHLDMDSLIWLEKFLQKFKGGMLIVSHDRDFLNRISTHTMEICEGKLTIYTGTIDAFLVWKRENTNTEARRVKNLQDKISQTEHFITRFKSKNTKASQARSKMKQLEKLKDQMPEQEKISDTIHFQFPEPERSGSVPLKLENVTVAYEEVSVLQELSLTITRSDKIAIIGPNGAGKSTLLKTCAGIIKPRSGTVTVGYNTTINYFSQHRLEQLHPKKTLLDTITEVARQTDRTYARSLLGAFLFTDDEVFKEVGVLSGGEKSRLSLAMLLANPGNVIILDEPTNHLDIDSVEHLTNALIDFEGTLLFVSHDDYFISKIANRIIELRPGKFRDFPGTLADYRSYIEEGFVDSLTENSKQKTDEELRIVENKQERIAKRQEKIKIERKIGKIEERIGTIETEISNLETELHAPQNASLYSKLQEIQKKLDELHTLYNEHLHEWETLQTELEKCGAGE